MNKKKTSLHSSFWISRYAFVGDIFLFAIFGYEISYCKKQYAVVTTIVIAPTSRGTMRMTTR